jgi:hypothetical protein
MYKTVAFLLFVMFTTATAHATGTPIHKKDFSKCESEARKLIEECQYAEARKLYKNYIKKYQNNKLATGKVVEAEKMVPRLEKLYDLWLKAKKSPATEAYKFAAALIEKNLPYPFRSSPEERYKAFELMRDHDENMKKKIAERFPMSITVKWTEKGDFSEFEKVYLDELSSISKKAKIPVVHGMGNWSVGHALRFTPLGKTWSTTRMRSFKLGDDCRVKDEAGELKATWTVSKTFYHIDDHAAKHGAAKGLAEELLNRIIVWLFSE